MASLGLLLQRSLRLLSRNYTRNGPKRITQQMIVRNETTTPTGALHAKPIKTTLGLTKAFIVIVPFMYVGATMSKEGAAFLEENDIFVPDDDDD
ncbi:essential MCU regulator, mitochondrial-like [Saccoglossus kowalevskii]